MSEFPIVGIGASAGGLDAFEQFFRGASSQCGMAFVLVQHLDPEHVSISSHIGTLAMSHLEDAASEGDVPGSSVLKRVRRETLNYVSSLTSKRPRAPCHVGRRGRSF